MRASQLKDEGEPAARRRREVNVLVVENDTLQIRVTNLLFDAINEDVRCAAFYNTTVVTAGTEALQALAAGSFHLVMIDFQLPDFFADELIPLVRAAVGPTVAVVVISAYDTADVIERCVRARADAFLPKPLGIKTVSSLWQYCLRRNLHLLPPPSAGHVAGSVCEPSGPGRSTAGVSTDVAAEGQAYQPICDAACSGAECAGSSKPFDVQPGSWQGSPSSALAAPELPFGSDNCARGAAIASPLDSLATLRGPLPPRVPVRVGMPVPYSPASDHSTSFSYGRGTAGSISDEEQAPEGCRTH